MTSVRNIGRGLARAAGHVRYGVLAQSFSSATNFGLIVLAGHALGPRGVGMLFVGFPAYLVILGFQRSLVTEPLIVQSSSGTAYSQSARAGFALTITLAAGLIATGIVVAVGLAIPESLGRGMILFAPWLVPALLQDLGRSIVFRDYTGKRTTFSDASRLVTMAAAAPIAIGFGTDWAVVGAWGIGATCGAMVAFAQIRWTRARLRPTIHWWKSEAWQFGRWLGLGGMLYTVASFSSVLALISILGPRDFGGFVAVQSAFAPLTLLGPALTLPGLPLVSRLAKVSSRRALLLALRLGGLIMTLTAAYVVLLSAVPGALAVFFGPEFTAFRSIILPIGVGQVLLAPTFGATLFLKALQEGRLLFSLMSLYTLLNVSFAVTLASLFGLTGAAWGGAAAASLFGALLVGVLGLRTLGPTSPTAAATAPAHNVRS